MGGHISKTKEDATIYMWKERGEGVLNQNFRRGKKRRKINLWGKGKSERVGKVLK